MRVYDKIQELVRKAPSNPENALRVACMFDNAHFGKQFIDAQISLEDKKSVLLTGHVMFSSTTQIHWQALLNTRLSLAEQNSIKLGYAGANPYDNQELSEDEAEYFGTLWREMPVEITETLDEARCWLLTFLHGQYDAAQDSLAFI